MTCIVGIEHQGRVWIGGDSLATDDNGNIAHLRGEKVFRNGPLVIGVTGSLRCTQLLHHALRVPERRRGQSVDAWMCTDFIGAVRAAFAGGGWEKKKDDGEALGGFFLVGIGSALYAVDDDFCATRAREGYQAMGTGGRCAKGALYATRRQPVEYRIKMALRAACATNAFCAPPFTILTTRGPR